MRFLVVNDDNGILRGGAPGGDLLRQVPAQHLHPEHHLPITLTPSSSSSWRDELEDAGVPDAQTVGDDKVPPPRTELLALEFTTVGHRP